MLHEMLHEPTRLIVVVALAVSASGCFLMWVAGRLRKASALVDDIVYPGSARHRAALASVEDGTAPNLTVWRRLPTDRQEAYDTAVLDASAASEDAARRAGERAVEGAVRTNALYHP